MSLENNQPVKSDDNQEHSTKVDNSRRSFAKKSAAIAPVIMTLANRSAWGAGSQICAANQSLIGIQSYQVNANISHYGTLIPNTLWKNPGNWKSAIELVPGNSVTYATLIANLSAGGLTAYQTASQLNSTYYPPFPSGLLTTAASLADYTTFYQCAGGDNINLPAGFHGL